MIKIPGLITLELKHIILPIIFILSGIIIYNILKTTILRKKLWKIGIKEAINLKDLILKDKKLYEYLSFKKIDKDNCEMKRLYVKPKFRGNTYDLNRIAKGQIIDHFYDNKGKRNKKSVAYFGIMKK